jgi:anthranilate phosphoribosyltransferase
MMEQIPEFDRYAEALAAGRALQAEIDRLANENIRLECEVELFAAELGEMRTRNEQAAELIAHAVELMTPDQIGKWAGVRMWLESADETV